jgi:membrane protein YqaA with SNARE-associated domain
LLYSATIENQLHSWIVSYGGLGLLVVSFIAATILPLSSEAALLAALGFGMAPIEALLFASVGNCLGVSFNYWLGHVGRERLLERTLRSRAGQRSHAWMERYGKWSLLLSWLPIVGDPLTILAGVFNINVLFFAATAFGTRIARYGVIVAIAS